MKLNALIRLGSDWLLTLICLEFSSCMFLFSCFTLFTLWNPNFHGIPKLFWIPIPTNEVLKRISDKVTKVDDNEETKQIRLMMMRLVTIAMKICCKKITTIYYLVILRPKETKINIPNAAYRYVFSVLISLFFVMIPECLSKIVLGFSNRKRKTFATKNYETGIAVSFRKQQIKMSIPLTIL